MDYKWREKKGDSKTESERHPVASDPPRCLRRFFHARAQYLYRGTSQIAIEELPRLIRRDVICKGTVSTGWSHSFKNFPASGSCASLRGKRPARDTSEN